jgi:hypothetical protein
MVQVSMICPDPYIRDNVQTVLTQPEGWTKVPFTYKGTAETGFKVKILIKTDCTRITLVNNNQPMIIDHNFVVGDIVLINTNRGERNIQLIDANGAVRAPLIAKLNVNSRWLELHSQYNTMLTYGVSDGDGRGVITSLVYTPTYWGI